MGLGMNRDGGEMSNPAVKSNLFVCTRNSCRSQMAEGWVKKLKSDILVPQSAGRVAGRKKSAKMNISTEPINKFCSKERLSTLILERLLPTFSYLTLIRGGYIDA